jgi:hypothetical protein
MQATDAFNAAASLARAFALPAESVAGLGSAKVGF